MRDKRKIGEKRASPKKAHKKVRNSEKNSQKSENTAKCTKVAPTLIVS